jgi:predicted  nucleic acid-binding Zn-ribbon protein
MTDKNLVLPFIVEAHDGKETVSYPTELACVVCMAELQRKKAGFLRDTPEKVSFISKVYYPIWAVPLEDSCVIVDGSAFSSHQFTFKEPTNTGLFVEDLKKNSVVNQEFKAALSKQAKNIEKFASTASVSFRALIAEREMLNFFLACFKSGSFLSRDKDEVVLVPLEIDEKTAAETREAVTNCLRRLQANVKGLQYALEVLDEELEFHEHMITNEAELLKEKCEAEVLSLKPEVEKKVEKLKLKRDATVAHVLKGTEKKAEVLEKKRERYMRKLQGLEQRKESIRKRKRSTTRKAYGLEKSDREIIDAKKKIWALSSAIENIRKEGNKSVKEVEEEFRGTIALEEEKIKKLNSAYESKIDEKKKQITEMASEAASITKSVESLMAEMKREAQAFREQISVDWKLDDPALVCVPIYMIGYAKGNEERYSLFSPTTISEDVSVMKELRKILISEPRLKLLTRPRSNELHEMLSSRVIKRMQNEETFRENLNRLCRANNLLERRDFEKTLSEGLAEVEKKRWITAEEAVSVCSGIKGEEA